MAPITASGSAPPSPAAWTSSPRLRTPTGSHERIAIVELFGRNSGETSLFAAYLAHVDRAIISEVPFDPEKLAALLLEDKRANPSNYAIMTISEGATLLGGEIVETGEADAYGHKKLGGVGEITGDADQDDSPAKTSSTSSSAT